jgi:PAS domain S-box-containing protein
MTDELFPDAKLYAEQLKRLADTFASINFFLSVDETLRNITEQARQIIGAHQALTTLSINEDWSQAINSVSLSEKYADWKSYKEPLDGSGIYALLCQLNQPMRFTQSELEAHPGWRNFGKNVEKHPPMRGWLAAPLVSREGRNIGLLQLSDKYEGEFTESDEQILVHLAQVASVAIENARLYEQTKQNERRLNEREEEFRLILEATQVGVWHENFTSGEVRWSEGLEALLGVEGTPFTGTYDELIGLVHPEDRKSVEDSVKRSLQGYGLFSGDFRIIRPDNTTRWLAGKGKVSFDEQGRPVSRFGIAIDIQERKEADEKLRASEQRYRQLFENNPHPMWFYEIETLAFLSVNNAAVAHYGYSREEFLQMTLKDIRLTEDISTLVDDMVNFTSSQIHINSLRRHRKKDGSVIIVEVTSHDILFEGRKARLVMVNDITERKRAEAALLASEQRFSEAFNLSPLPMHIISLEDTRYIYVNDSFLQATGFSREELIGKTGDELKLWVSAQERAKIFKAFRENQRLSNLEFRYRRKDGEIRTGLGSSERITLDGQPCALSVINDITEHKRAEEDRDRFFTVSRDMLCLMDFAGYFTRLNPAWEKTLGYSNEELMAKTYIHFVHPDDREKALEVGKKVMTGESVQAFENRYRCKDGSVKWLLWSLTSYPEQQLVYAVAHDITERKRAEEEWKKAEENLRQAQKMDAIGRLAGGVAHDFNNLMTAVIGYSEMALRKTEPESAISNDILEIKKAGERAASLTSQLLAFGRKQMLQPKILNLNAVLENIHKMLRRLIGEHIDIAVMPEPNLGLVKADPGQIEQVIVNLAVNARDAMPEGGKLTLETANVHISDEYAFNHMEVTPGHYVLFAMTDNGIGMDVKTMARIFEPFYTTKELGKGTGLGLSMVYGIIKQSGGHIAVYSEPGIGTTVKLYLPRIDEEPALPEPQAVMTAPKPANATILLVEDEKVVRDLTAKILGDLGYEVLVAENGKQALEVATGNLEKIALVISDIVMPQLGGRELVERLLQLKPRLKIIFISGYTENSMLHQGVLDKHLIFLQKPFSYEALASRVREALRDIEAAGE